MLFLRVKSRYLFSNLFFLSNSVTDTIPKVSSAKIIKINKYVGYIMKNINI